jgi:hypothetical protein
MGRPYRGRRRRRPRRRLRYRGAGLPPRSHSYQNFGLRAFYDLFVPRGRSRRLFFNDVCGWMALMFGALGAVFGWTMLGPFGLFLGFGLGASLGGRFLTKNRYYRP